MGETFGNTHSPTPNRSYLLFYNHSHLLASQHGFYPKVFQLSPIQRRISSLLIFTYSLGLLSASPTSMLPAQGREFSLLCSGPYTQHLAYLPGTQWTIKNIHRKKFYISSYKGYSPLEKVGGYRHLEHFLFSPPWFPSNITANKEGGEVDWLRKLKLTPSLENQKAPPRDLIGFSGCTLSISYKDIWEASDCQGRAETRIHGSNHFSRILSITQEKIHCSLTRLHVKTPTECPIFLPQ